MEISIRLFIFPMWSSENERIGLKKCCPLSSILRTLAELGGFIGLFLLFGAIIFLVYKGIIGEFSNQLWWFLLYPYLLGFINMLLFLFAYIMADKKSYKYDYEKNVTIWQENGKEKIYSE